METELLIERRRAKTRQEIAEEYGIDRKTLYRWLRRLNIELPKGLIFPSFQKVIYEELGTPHQLQFKEFHGKSLQRSISPQIPQYAPNAPRRTLIK
jgi:hypothetical protein